MTKTPLWEDILLILAIFMLWPVILRQPPLISNISLFFSFCIAGIILIRRIKRFQRHSPEKIEAKKTIHH
ncbi:MAG TPA: hypothetical protein P5065_05640 [Candidatus Ratteibacteria bacterium]|jgi:hypothetical protein|uniref:Uncharacterized protein n=1 Tax=candidate division TA06 bacterium ADurb.Bin131 TaxID=1852827 RepID=A0A1V6C667_UNCT6|nr:MAG: hypothetical protein BWX89_01339 [candidate division TA06 bacterium ADurb.Bin131]HON06145.1 hypothetical protein [bacterium]HRS06505.1 hypothetical protein [Candidatus Ratteibacteria bacterium]HRV04551.1 hypothetical protein [Candidatus Ratteibacteria bacterium]